MKQNNDIIDSFRYIINLFFGIDNTSTDINSSKNLFIYKIVFRDNANSSFWYH